MKGIEKIRNLICGKKITTKKAFAIQGILHATERADYHAKNFIQLGIKNPDSPILNFELKAYINSLQDLYRCFFLIKNTKKVPHLKKIVGAKDVSENQITDLFASGFLANENGIDGAKNGRYKILREQSEEIFHLEKDHEIIMDETAVAAETLE